MIRLSKYPDSENRHSEVCYVNEEEIASIEEYLHHSFRDSISKITLKNGVHLKVWEKPDDIYRQIERLNIRK